MINKMSSRSELKDDFQEVISKLLGKGKQVGRRNTTVSALVELYKFNPSNAGGEKYDKLIVKLDKLSKKKGGYEALFKIPTTRSEINAFIAQEVLPMKDPDTFAQAVSTVLEIPNSDDEQSTSTTKTRAEREIERGRSEARDAASLRALQKLKDSGAGAGAGAQEEEKEEVRPAAVVSKPSYAGVAKRAQDREKIVQDYLALQREESERDNVEALAYLADQQERQALDQEAISFKNTDTNIRTRVDRVADNSLLPTQPFTNLPGVVDEYTGGNVPTLQQGTTSAQSASSVDDVKQTYINYGVTKEEFDREQTAVIRAEANIFRQQENTNELNNDRRLVDPLSRSGAQNLDSADLLVDNANSVSVSSSGKTSLPSQIQNTVTNTLSSIAEEGVSNVISGALPALPQASAEAQARVAIYEDIGIPAPAAVMAEVVYQDAVTGLPQVVRNALDVVAPAAVAAVRSFVDPMAEAYQGARAEVEADVMKQAITDRMEERGDALPFRDAADGIERPAPPPPTYLGDRARQDGILYDVTALDGSAPASVVGAGGPATVGDASQKSTDELKKEIDALCYIYESIIPAFGSQQLKAEKQIVLRSSSRPVVMAFYQQLMNMVRQHFQSTGMRVGVIVSPESMGMGGGGGGGGGAGMEGSPLPGMGGNVRINRHGDNVLAQEGDVRRDAQGVLRGGRNYRSIIQSRIPTNLPELKTAPSRLPLMRSFANTPMPGRIRIAKHSISGINLR